MDKDDDTVYVNVTFRMLRVNRRQLKQYLAAIDMTQQDFFDAATREKIKRDFYDKKDNDTC